MQRVRADVPDRRAEFRTGGSRDGKRDQARSRLARGIAGVDAGNSCEREEGGGVKFATMGFILLCTTSAGLCDERIADRVDHSAFDLILRENVRDERVDYAAIRS